MSVTDCTTYKSSVRDRKYLLLNFLFGLSVQLAKTTVARNALIRHIGSFLLYSYMFITC